MTVREITARLAVPLLPDSQPLMQVFLEFISVVREKAEFLRAEATDYELKSLRVECGPVPTAVV